ncbi:uncharacterized protein LOC131597715 [Vicia villosa]|uniref:uncharacterized protein LOC131597715 n=1 Tax=Vicia villosa TaxID=3911 RepID=UPI00273B904A|nr:uncharacterized protein LOC131597715 [Vicia villosa]
MLKVDLEKAYDSISWKYLRLILKEIGFGDIWMNWMDACIFMSHLSFLVNGSATKDFKAQRGLRQGDPLSPFLFVLAMEGLTALVHKSVALGEFKLFKYGVEDFVDILQFADGTIILGEPSNDNLWYLKVVLRGFELVSGLKINFSKSNVCGVNISESFMNSAKSFLGCKKGSISFLFLGIMVGANPRRKKTRLKNKRSIHWVKWETVCKPKEKGVLGLRDVGEINKALLYKWKWRILKEDKAIWSKLLQVRYVEPKNKILAPCEMVVCSNDSMWWRDILRNDVKTDCNEEILSGFIQCEVKKGTHIPFWFGNWIGDQILSIKFPDLFDISINKLCTVTDVFYWEDNGTVWNSVLLFGPEFGEGLSAASRSMQQAWRDFKLLLSDVRLEGGRSDAFRWRPNDNGEFTVASVNSLISENKDSVWLPNKVSMLNVMWKPIVPPRI